MSKLNERLFRMIGDHRDARAFRIGARIARRYVDAYENRNFNPRTNGEYRVLSIIGRQDPGLLFDVGANVGDWTAEATRVAPSAEIHAFELQPEVRRGLAQRFANEPQVQVAPTGLADEPGEVRFRTLPGRSDYGSMVTESLGPRTETGTGAVIRGDDYLDRNEIGRVDFVKIDTEGADFGVLRGFDRTLRSGRISAVQFEYGLWSVQTLQLLKHFYELFDGHGYRVGKIYPRSVDFRTYEVQRDENHWGANYLAVLARESELVAALR